MREEVLSLLTRHMSGPFKPSGGSNMLARCPFHKGGEERKPSFSVNVATGMFQCFTCHVAGDIRYLLRMLGLPRSTIDAETKIIKPLLDAAREQYRVEKENTFSNAEPFRAKRALPEAILGIYDWCPMGLVQKGFDVGLLQDMEVGFDRAQNRVTYPLRDLYGDLAGISGGATLPDQWPKYKVYQGARKDYDGRWVSGDFGEWFDKEYPGYTCENHQFLWNYHRVYPRLTETSDRNATIYVVEGFKACLWMLQAGYLNTVALMGSSISDRQQQLLHRLSANVVLCLDNDDAGRKAALRVGELLWRPMHGRVRVMQYPVQDNNTQPDDYPINSLRALVDNSVNYLEYIKHRSKRLWH